MVRKSQITVEGSPVPLHSTMLALMIKQSQVGHSIRVMQYNVTRKSTEMLQNISNTLGPPKLSFTPPTNATVDQKTLWMKAMVDQNSHS